MKRIWLCISVVAGALSSGCDAPADPPAAPEPKVATNTVEFPQGSREGGSIQSEVVKLRARPAIQLNGRLTWNEDQTVRVYTPFAGRVQRILAQPGERVHQGQVLAVVASPDFGQAQADARRAEVDFTAAQQNLARMRELTEHGVAARKDLQSAEADQRRTRAELDRTRARLALYGARRDAVDQTYALTSPIAGTVVEKNINPGQELRPDQMLANAPPQFVITNPNTLWALLEAAESDLPLLRPGKVVTVRVPAYRDEAFPATIGAIADFLDPVTRTIRVRSVIGNPGRKLKSEMFITAEVSADGEMELLVPAKTIFFDGGRRYVFVDKGGGKYVRSEVRIGDIRDNRIEILQGLSEGEKVVTEGSLMLQQILQPRRVQK